MSDHNDIQDAFVAIMRLAVGKSMQAASEDLMSRLSDLMGEEGLYLIVGLAAITDEGVTPLAMCSKGSPNVEKDKSGKGAVMDEVLRAFLAESKG